MLDNSAVMWLPQFADGDAHNVNNPPIVIAGSSATGGVGPESERRAGVLAVAPWGRGEHGPRVSTNRGGSAGGNGGMSSARDWVSLVERSYDLKSDDESWLTAVFDQ